MFERFTDRARQVMVLAQYEARLLEHDYIGTEHLLLGLLAEGEGVAARVLEWLGVDLEDTRAQVLDMVGGSTDEIATGELPVTPRTKKVLEIALREALKLGHNYVGTEHLLLALDVENEGLAAHILRDAGNDVDKVRNEVVRLLLPQGTASGVSRDFDDAARRAVYLAMDESLDRDDQRITCEHLLAGLAATEETLAARILADHGLNADAVRLELDRNRNP